MSFSVAANIVLVLALGCVSYLLILERELRKQRGLFREWPVRRVLPEEFDPVFKAGPHGPTRDTEIRSIGSYRVEGGIGDFETWVI